MKIIISPAKKMNSLGSELGETTEPVFQERAEYLRSRLQAMCLQQLKERQARGGELPAAAGV